eukprot:COSAG06_NODE_19982_length_814_cov_1.965035_2_plen_88_part_00
MEDKMKKKRDASGLDGDSVPSPLRAHELAKKKTRPRVEPARKAPSELGDILNYPLSDRFGRNLNSKRSKPATQGSRIAQTPGSWLLA